MAKMYSRKRGKSGSKNPVKNTLPSWVRYKAKEVELLVAKLAKDGKSSGEIGQFLRDVYGIPSVRLVTGKRVGKILDEKKLAKSLPEDLLNLIRKGVEIRKHLEENHKDYTAKRGLQLTDSKIGRLVKYYKQTGKIEPSWKYKPEQARFYLE